MGGIRSSKSKQLVMWFVLVASLLLPDTFSRLLPKEASSALAAGPPLGAAP